MKNTLTVRVREIGQDAIEIKEVVSIQSNLGGFLISTTEESHQFAGNTEIIIYGSDDYREANGLD